MYLQLGVYASTAVIHDIIPLPTIYPAHHALADQMIRQLVPDIPCCKLLADNPSVVSTTAAFTDSGGRFRSRPCTGVLHPQRG